MKFLKSDIKENITNNFSLFDALINLIFQSEFIYYA